MESCRGPGLNGLIQYQPPQVRAFTNAALPGFFFESLRFLFIQPQADFVCVFRLLHAPFYSGGDRKNTAPLGGIRVGVSPQVVQKISLRYACGSSAQGRGCPALL